MKLALFGHLVGLDAKVLHDDLLHSLGDITHRSNLCVSNMGSISDAIEVVASRASLVADEAGSRTDRERTAQSRARPSRLSPARLGLGYHTSKALTSRPRRPQTRYAISHDQIIAMPPFTCSVWPVT